MIALLWLSSVRDRFSIRVFLSSRTADFTIGFGFMKAGDLFKFPDSLPFANEFCVEMAPWEWLPIVRKALSKLPEDVVVSDCPAGLHVEGPVYIHPSVRLPAFGSIQGPAYIAEGCELRPGVFIRGNVIAGAGCVLGNSCEFKNCLLLDRVQVPHFSYVGDSILGNGSHLGAGVVCSNLRLDQTEVQVKLLDGTKCGTGLRKLGAIVGDGAEVGCNAVLNPGSILGPRALVMPSVSFIGTLAGAQVAYTKAPIQTTLRGER
jgi:NDP-sugar pyrophosphorylase family protein